jgi:hypothetical protein
MQFLSTEAIRSQWLSNIFSTFRRTVKKTKRDVGPKHVGEGKFRHPRRSTGSIYVDNGFFRLIYVYDGIFRQPHVLGLRHAWLL